MQKQHLTVLHLSIFLLTAVQLDAQDKVISLRGTEERVTEGLIVGTTPDGSPRIRTPDGVETTVRISEVRRIIKNEPEALSQARKFFKEEDFDKAIELASPVATQFSGLPVSWAVEAFGIVADAHLQKGDRENAKNWFERIAQAYAQTQFKAKGEIGIAKLALLDGNIGAAENTVRELVEQAKSTLRPGPAQSQIFAEAFFLQAKIQERNNMFAQALESYLRIPTLYPENPTLVNQALAAASQLKSRHKIFVE